jgi:hypothetical protein
MKIQPVNNISFGIRIKIDKASLNKAVQNFYNNAPDGAKASLGSSTLMGSSSTAVGVPATNTVATGSDIIGTAFILKPMDIDSYGIVPSVLAKMTPYATPETVESSAFHPETAGAIFSTMGSELHKHARIKINNTKKIPS